MVREMARTSIAVSNRVSKGVKGKCLILVKMTSASAGRVTSGVVQGVVKLHVFRSRRKGAGLSLTSISKNLLLISRFALCTGYGEKGEPDFVRTKGPSVTGRVCRCVVRGYERSISRMRAKRFKTSVGIRLLGSKPFAVLLSSSRLWLSGRARMICVWFYILLRHGGLS